MKLNLLPNGVCPKNDECLVKGKADMFFFFPYAACSLRVDQWASAFTPAYHVSQSITHLTLCVHAEFISTTHGLFSCSK